MKKYNIGDKVVTAEGVVGELRDVLYSAARNTNLILIKPADGAKQFTRAEDEVELYTEPANYSAEITYERENVIRATIYKDTAEGKVEISRGYGRMQDIEDMAASFAQAAAFATKVAYRKIVDGEAAE